MELSIHDNILYAYLVVSEQEDPYLYTITLFTEFSDSSSSEYTDIVFTGVLTHHFEHELSHSILFDVEERDFEYIYENDPDLFERSKDYGWPPYMRTTFAELIATLKTQDIKAFVISTSYGLDGWIWAKQMTKVQRNTRKEFV